MAKQYFHLQGAAYAYKIKYEDISSLFLLDKPDNRMAFVIALEKPIRQGMQKYQHLVLETHKLDQTLQLNLTEEENEKDYDGQLTSTMTFPMSSLIAKLFKVLSGRKVDNDLSIKMSFFNSPNFNEFHRFLYRNIMCLRETISVCVAQSKQMMDYYTHLQSLSFSSTSPLSS